jgi:hypothetical protein
MNEYEQLKPIVRFSTLPVLHAIVINTGIAFRQSLVCIYMAMT